MQILLQKVKAQDCDFWMNCKRMSLKTKKRLRHETRVINSRKLMSIAGMRFAESLKTRSTSADFRKEWHMRYETFTLVPKITSIIGCWTVIIVHPHILSTSASEIFNSSEKIWPRTKNIYFFSLQASEPQSERHYWITIGDETLKRKKCFLKVERTFLEK